MTRLPVYVRHGAPTKGQLTERDLGILVHLRDYRYLQTNQIQRLVFPDVRTPQSPRRRLKFLYHNAYVNRLPMPIHPGLGGSEAVYYLDKVGYQAIDPHQSIPWGYRKSAQVKPHFLAHAIALSEFRVRLSEALAGQSIVELTRFIPDFMLKSNLTGVSGMHRLRLYEELRDPITKDPLVVYPDAEIVLQGQGIYSDHKQLYFLEIDRGTEGLAVIQRKVAGYEVYRQTGRFKKKGEFDDFVVLLQTTSMARAENIKNHLQHVTGQQSIWVTTEDDVSSANVLTSPIWKKADGSVRCILN